MGFGNFDEFVKDFDLKDGDGISARQIFTKQIGTTPLNTNSTDGDVCFTFEDMTLKTTEIILSFEKRISYSKKNCIFTYLKDDEQKKNGFLVICGLEDEENTLFQVVLTDFAKKTAQ